MLPILVIFLLTVPGFGQSPVFRNVAYAATSNSRQMLDIYLPAGDGPFPVVIWVHGGGWISGSKEGANGTPELLLPRGIAVAAINYRLATEAQFPAQIRDVKSAIRFLRANAAMYRLDPDRIAIAGASAGGHLASLAGVTAGERRWDFEGMTNRGMSERVAAVFTLFGPSEIGPSSEPLPGVCIPGTDQGVLLAASLLLGCPLCEDRVKEASPLTYLTPDDPPFLVLHGTSDCTVPVEQSRLLAEALRRQGLAVTYRLVPEAGHGARQFDQPPLSTFIADFFERTLRGPIRSASAADYQFVQAAPNEMRALFGAGFSVETATASMLPLPVTLGGVTISVTAEEASARPARLIAVSPTQVNFLMPEVAAGAASVSLSPAGGGPPVTERLRVTASAPSLFIVPVDGADYAVGEAVWFDAAGRQQRRLIVERDTSGNWRANPLPFFSANGPVTIVMYGTGLNASPSACTGVVFDRRVAVKYAGPQGQYPGLDQYNVEIPRDVVRRGTVTLTVDCTGLPATPVRLRAEP